MIAFRERVGAQVIAGATAQSAAKTVGLSAGLHRPLRHDGIDALCIFVAHIEK